MSRQFDIVIIGGGLVGVTMALALSQLNLNIALIEAKTEKRIQEPSLETRSLALSYGSAKILQGLGLWQFLQSQSTAIKHIHVSDRGHFGFARLNAEQSKTEALGYVIEIQALLAVLYQQLHSSRVKSFSQASLKHLQQSDDQVRLDIESAEGALSITSKLVLGADGAHSTVRQLLGINLEEHDYQQVAIASNIGLKRDHQHNAYERFTAEGPLALLPLSEQRMAMVWTVKKQHVQQILAQSDSDFLKSLQMAFGYRAGKFLAIGKRQTYPLKQLKVSSHYKGRVALIGNSAHSLHPVGGQGFNLSMRDIAALALLSLSSISL
ncbi:MAG: 2-octaprenyl-3-methyl-6-methoxy,4-benzoquinol hydroxylase / 2-octaprenyl-6-methoxyphenol [Gammaproteobacteria bacterium]|nr:2-octaprenyl-3-methyl-6-methoxy,4-benzoquinol hydroxylase / 2-octaprenyl-6-methoxyphenol [Gammaproteobacteria bacterium]